MQEHLKIGGSSPWYNTLVFSCQGRSFKDSSLQDGGNSSKENEYGLWNNFFALALVGKDIVFRSIIEYSSLRDFGP
jgi:hypothetical protein